MAPDAERTSAPGIVADHAAPPTAAETAAETAGPPGAAEAAGRRWWVLGVVGLAQLMVVLDLTVMNIALPSAQRGAAFHHGRPAVGGNRLLAGVRQLAAAGRQAG